mgnify:CR=1 FL=1
MAGSATGAKNHAEHTTSAVLNAGYDAGQAELQRAEAGPVIVFFQDDDAQQLHP